MNTIETVDQAEQPPTEAAEQSGVVTRDMIAKQIVVAQLPQQTKKLAGKLLERCMIVGDPFYIQTNILNQLCHAASSREAIAHLYKMRKAKLLEYSVDWQTSQVTMKFVGKVNQTATA